MLPKSGIASAQEFHDLSDDLGPDGQGKVGVRHDDVAGRSRQSGRGDAHLAVMRRGQWRPEGRQGSIPGDDERLIVGRAQCDRVACRTGLKRRQVGAGQPSAEGAFGPEVRRFAPMVGRAQKDHAP